MSAEAVVSVVPSPNSQRYVAIDPRASDEAEPSKRVSCPAEAACALNAAVGACAGVIATSNANPPTAIGGPSRAFVAVENAETASVPPGRTAPNARPMAG